MSVLKKHYKMETDWNGELYCRFTLKWNSQEGYVGIFMPKYVQKKTRGVLLQTIQAPSIFSISTESHQIWKEFR
jgi:hypothetical protein